MKENCIDCGMANNGRRCVPDDFDCPLGFSRRESYSPTNTENESLRDDDPCNHPGCLNHASHPCEGCGRVGGVSSHTPAAEKEDLINMDATHYECPECGGAVPHGMKCHHNL